jgi:hypothetical protein
MRAVFAGVITLLFATPAFCEVDVRQLRYLEAWEVGDSAAKIIERLGTPDFVVLPTDKSEFGRALREDGIAKQWFWKVKGGCQPIKMDFDARGRSTGVDYSALKSSCMTELAHLVTPGPEASCSNADRKAFCR